MYKIPVTDNDSFASIVPFLEHPLVLLILGALLTGLILPAITRRWTIQQNQMALKSELTKLIVESVSRMLVSSEFVHQAVLSLQRAQQDQVQGWQDRLDEDMKACAEEIRAWAGNRAVVQATLETRFTGAFVANEWKGLSEAVEIFSGLASRPLDLDTRNGINNLYNTISLKQPPPEYHRGLHRDEDVFEWHCMQRAIEDNVDAICASIFRSEPKSILPPSWIAKARWRLRHALLMSTTGIHLREEKHSAHPSIEFKTVEEAVAADDTKVEFDFGKDTHVEATVLKPDPEYGPTNKRTLYISLWTTRKHSYYSKPRYTFERNEIRQRLLSELDTKLKSSYEVDVADVFEDERG